MDTLLITGANYTIIYYHCLHGEDRTSALTAAYMMKYKDKTLEEVLENHAPAGAKDFDHPWEPNYKCLVEYYSQSLKH